MSERNPPYVLQDASHGAELFRQATGSLIDPAGGLIAAGGLLISEHIPAAMSVSVLGGTPAQGALWVPGSAGEQQGMYFCWNDATVTLAIGAANAANPRIDTVAAVVDDEAVGGSGNEWKLEVIPGTPEAGATLENLKGKGELPDNAYVLAYVLVPAKATTIKNAEVKNMATQAKLRSGNLPTQRLVPGASYATGFIVNLVEPPHEGTFTPSAVADTFCNVLLFVEKAEPSVETGAIIEVRIPGGEWETAGWFFATPNTGTIGRGTVSLVLKAKEEIRVKAFGAVYQFQCHYRGLTSPVAV